MCHQHATLQSAWLPERRVLNIIILYRRRKREAHQSTSQEENTQEMTEEVSCYLVIVLWYTESGKCKFYNA